MKKKNEISAASKKFKNQNNRGKGHGQKRHKIFCRENPYLWSSGAQEKLIQLNARVPLSLKKTYKRIAKRTQFGLETIVADALIFYTNLSNRELIVRRNKFLSEWTKFYGSKLNQGNYDPKIAEPEISCSLSPQFYQKLAEIIKNVPRRM